MIKNLSVHMISDVKMKGSKFAIDQTLDQITPERVYLLTSKDITSWRPEVEIVKVDPITSVNAISQFMVYELYKYMPFPHTLNIQWDGYVLNGKAWNDKFLEVDYIGAPHFANHTWYHLRPPLDKPVMNGGFSIRSKRFQEEIIKQKYVYPYPPEASIPFYEDQYTTRIWRHDLEESGIKFAHWELAETFSVEAGPYDGQFGWHGVLYGPEYTHGKVIAD